MKSKKLIRVTTVPVSLSKLLKGQMRYMSSYYEVVAVSSNGTMLQKISDYEGIQVKSLEMTRKITLIKDLRSLLQMIVFLRKEKPLIVHTHTPKAGIIGMLAARLVGVPVRMHTVAGLPLMETKGAKRKLLDFAEKLTYHCATKIYPNSKGLYDFILQNKFTTKEKLKVIGNGSSNGINTCHFSPDFFSPEFKVSFRKELGINIDDFVFIFVGRLVRDKGINELVTAFKRINSTTKTNNINSCLIPLHLQMERDGVRSKLKIQNCKLLLVGPLEAELDPLLPLILTEIKDNKNIISAGFQDDVRPWLAIANALVFPSYREGFPNVVMQAGAMGLPSIVTDINGCNEIIFNGVNGIIIPSKNIQALTDAMLKFITNLELVSYLSSNARESIVSRFDQKYLWPLIKEEYDNQLKNAGLL